LIYALYILEVLVCIFLILVILLQQGSGADLSVFGGGATQTAFGARSATQVIHKLTVWGFVAFILLTLAIAVLRAPDVPSVMRGVNPLVIDPVVPGGEELVPETAPEASPTTEFMLEGPQPDDAVPGGVERLEEEGALPPPEVP
jgi:preprotein translocase subunit SecG